MTRSELSFRFTEGVAINKKASLPSRILAERDILRRGVNGDPIWENYNEIFKKIQKNFIV